MTKKSLKSLVAHLLKLSVNAQKLLDKEKVSAIVKVIQQEFGAQQGLKILQLYQQALKRYLHKNTLRVFSAEPIKETENANFVTHFLACVDPIPKSRTLHTEFIHAPQLIGGFQFKLEDTAWSFSVQDQLQQFKNLFTA